MPLTRRIATQVPALALALALMGGMPLAPVSAAFAAGERGTTDALIWTGASSRVARPSLDRRDRAAILAFEQRLGSRADGWLDPGETDALLAVAERARAREGYRVVADPATGATIGLPTAWLAGRRDTAAGSAWRSPDGAIEVETFALDADLDVFERMERARGGANITYVAGRDRWRVVSGYVPGGRTLYARAARTDGGMVGFRVTYETALGQRLDRVAVAMSSDFRAPAFRPRMERDVEGRTDVLAYAPTYAPWDDGIVGPATPSYEVLPPAGPAPRARPVVASLGTEPGGTLDAEPGGSPGAVRGVPRAVRAPEADEERPTALPRTQDVTPRDGRPDGAAGGAAGGAPAERAAVPDRPATPPAPPAPPAPAGPVMLDDDAGADALDPVRGAAVPDDEATEATVPATIVGLITDEGQSCPTLRGADGTLYAMVGEVPNLEPGTLVSVEAVGIDTERCSAGRTVAVGGFTVRASPQ